MKKVYTNNRVRFLEVAERRTNKAIKAIRILGHCGNKFLYDYKPAEIDKILNALSSELVDLKSKLKPSFASRFSLNDNNYSVK